MLNNRTIYKDNAIVFRDIRFRIRGIFTSKPIEFNEKASDMFNFRSDRVEQISAIVKTNFTKFTFYTKSS